jgi:hypothetical protein
MGKGFLAETGTGQWIVPQMICQGEEKIKDIFNVDERQ